jgi:hypothetical protein
VATEPCMSFGILADKYFDEPSEIAGLFNKLCEAIRKKETSGQIEAINWIRYNLKSDLRFSKDVLSGE